MGRGPKSVAQAADHLEVHGARQGAIFLARIKAADALHVDHDGIAPAMRQIAPRGVRGVVLTAQAPQIDRAPSHHLLLTRTQRSAHRVGASLAELQAENTSKTAAKPSFSHAFHLFSPPFGALIDATVVTDALASVITAAQA